MDKHKFKKILDRYREGKANETETALVEAWYKSYSTDEAVLGNDEAEELHRAMKQHIKTAITPKTIFRMPLFRVAAILTVFLAATLLIWNSGKDDYALITNNGKEVKKVMLADGSEVWLNAASRLKAPAKFNGNTRDVFLEEGEAFFSVKKDKQHPFIVHTRPLKIQVLGTSFDIKAYEKLHTISVSVATGKVGVDQDDRTLATLTPGQQLLFDVISGATRLKNIDPEQAQSWKDGFTYLDQANFDELALTLKNIYGINIKTESKTISNYQFSLGLIHKLPSSQILELINQIHHTHFKKEGNDIIIY